MLRAVALTILLAGCTAPLPGDNAIVTSPTGAPPAPVGPPLVFGGVVRDATSGEPIADAAVRIDLAQAVPCGKQGVGWSSWTPEGANGTFGPLEVPRPRSDDVAFFLHARAPGYSPNATFVGPQQARGDLANLTVLLHPNATLEGTAPPGTLLALDAPGFPRVTVAGANGSYAFPGARVAPAMLVAATDVPFRTLATPPARVDVPDVTARGWVVEGTVKGPSGAPLAADVVAWNGSSLVGVARAGPSGAFALALAPEPQSLRIEARSAGDQYGAVLALDLVGPPATRETLLARALC